MSSSQRVPLFGIPIIPQNEKATAVKGLVAFLEDEDRCLVPELFQDFDAHNDEVHSIIRDIGTRQTEAAKFFGGAALANARERLSGYSTYAIAEVLRRYLISLPEPLLSFKFYDSFVIADTIPDFENKLAQYRFIIKRLAPGYSCAAGTLLEFLNRLHRNSEATHTNAESLAKVFWPIFLRPSNVVAYMQGDEEVLIKTVTVIIENYNLLWSADLDGKPIESSQKVTDPSVAQPPFYCVTSPPGNQRQEQAPRKAACQKVSARKSTAESDTFLPNTIKRVPPNGFKLIDP